MPFDGDTTIIETHIAALDTLRYGRAQIAAGRWFQGGYSDADGSRCAVSWIDEAPALPGYPSGFRGLALRALYDALPSTARRRSCWPTRCITAYNDSRTRESVLALYDRAIATLEGTQ